MEHVPFFKRHSELIKWVTDLLKWIIGSGAIVWATFIIDKGFKERSAGIQEMQAFDKYVEVILEADNIEKRWKLSEFFSTVTPTDRLRDKWVEYKKLINNEYETFKRLEGEQRLETIKANTGDPEAIKRLKEIQNELEPYQQPLIEPEKIHKKAKLSDYDQKLEDNLKVFKDHYNDALLSPKKLNAIFKKTDQVIDNVSKKLENDLGDDFTVSYSHQSSDVTTMTSSGTLYIGSRDDLIKNFYGVFKVTITDKAFNVIICKDGFSPTESFTTDIQNIEWDKFKSFARNYFLKRLDQLK